MFAHLIFSVYAHRFSPGGPKGSSAVQKDRRVQTRLMTVFDFMSNSLHTVCSGLRGIACPISGEGFGLTGLDPNPPGTHQNTAFGLPRRSTSTAPGLPDHYGTGTLKLRSVFGLQEVSCANPQTTVNSRLGGQVPVGPALSQQLGYQQSSRSHV